MQPMLDTFNKAGTFGYAYALLPLLTCRRSRVGQQQKKKHVGSQFEVFQCFFLPTLMTYELDDLGSTILGNPFCFLGSGKADVLRYVSCCVCINPVIIWEYPILTHP